MTRCDHDGLFYRVFCVTLLAIALTFTVILTNVFIDIDGLLSGKEKGKSLVSTEPTQKKNEAYSQHKDNVNTQREEKRNPFYFKPDLDDTDNIYRTKRSLDPKKIQNHLKDPKMKEILTNRLSTLLEELDNEETKADKEHSTKISAENVEQFTLKKDVDVKLSKKKGEELLHLAMHNILLQGIIGHMDLNEVYKKVHLLVKNFGNTEDDKKEKYIKEKNVDDPDGTKGDPSLSSVENKFFDELIKCDELKKQIQISAGKQNGDKPMNGRRSEINDILLPKTEKRVSGPQMLIKTVIDIKTLNKDKHKENKTDVNEKNIKGLIKLIYNGKSIQFTRLEDNEDMNRNNAEPNPDLDRKEDSDIQEKKANILDLYLDRAITHYMQKYPASETNLKNKRSKRNVKVKERVRTTTKTPEKSKNDEEELFVEIETHFDSDGIKGDKKKKLIKDLIEKIQKAIHTNIDTLQSTKKKTKKQSKPPNTGFKEQNALKNKILLPMSKIVERVSEPISKTVRLEQPVPLVSDKTGEKWKKQYLGSSFLTKSKSINSGEYGQVDLNYRKVLRDSGIPQRLQQPLNTDNIEEPENNEYFDMGDIKFYLKDIGGTGFSIGFNQYVGEIPDPDKTKLFRGLQQLLQTNQPNDDSKTKNSFTVKERPSYERDREYFHEVKKREVHRHHLPGQGVFDNDYHSNEYKIIFDNQYLPYDSYSEIFEDQNKKVAVSINKQGRNENAVRAALDDIDALKESQSVPIIIDDNLFRKNLKPSEIFGLASLLDRKKRSSNTLQLTNVKRSKFIDTDTQTKRFDSKNERRKRQVDKIRIIASDNLPSMRRHSDENVFVVSDENMFADRAVVREVDLPTPSVERTEDHGEVFNGRQIYEPQAHSFQYNQYPHHYPAFNTMFSGRSRQNALMSKYPHLFLEEMARSKEEENPYFYSKILGDFGDIQNNFDITTPSLTAAKIQSGSDILTEVGQPKSNYKVTVKIFPKNGTDNHSGFKEIHTSINKSINRNGLVYSSQVNVSEVSKIENLKLNTANEVPVPSPPAPPQPPPPPPPTPTTTTTDYIFTTERTTTTTREASTSYLPLVKRIKEQQEKMKQLLRQHRKRIDDQLDTLKKEKQNIESIIVPESKKPDLIDVMLPLEPPQMLHLNKAEAGQLITSALMKLHDAPQINDIGLQKELLTNFSYFVRSEKSTTLPTTTTKKPRPTIEPDKLRLLRTIQRNENLTQAILSKIDTNTNLLQLFLQKLSDKVQTRTEAKAEYSEPTQEVPRTKEISYPYPKEWKNAYLQSPFFNQALTNLEVNKNSSLMSIPFVYAYQQPYTLPSKPNSPVASVVYQGHIHTNTNTYNPNPNANINKSRRDDDKSRKLPNMKRDINQTRFFFDDIENDYNKMMQIENSKKAFDMRRIQNMTKI